MNELEVQILLRHLHMKNYWMRFFKEWWIEMALRIGMNGLPCNVFGLFIGNECFIAEDLEEQEAIRRVQPKLI